MKIKNLIIPLFVALAFVACEDKDEKEGLEEQPQAELRANYDVPFTLSLTSGGTISMKRSGEGFEISGDGRATLFIFFTTWCQPCKAQMAYLPELQTKFEKDLRIVGVLAEEGASAEDFAKDSNLNFPIASGESVFFFAKAAGDVSSLPYMLLLSAEGERKMELEGMIPIEMLETEIKKAVL